MNRIPSLLFVVVAGVHYGYEPLSEFYAKPEDAARALFYALRGVEAACLYAIVWRLARGGSLAYRIGLGIACGWGILENLQTTVCRAALGFGQSVSAPPYHGLCDVVTGYPVYAMTMICVLVIAAFNQDSRDGKG